MKDHRVSIDCTFSFTVKAENAEDARAQAEKIIQVLEDEANPTAQRKYLFHSDKTAREERINNDHIDGCFYVGNPQAKNSICVE